MENYANKLRALSDPGIVIVDLKIVTRVKS